MKTKDKKFTIEFYETPDYDGQKLKQSDKPIVVDYSLLKAREIGKQLRREGRFISLKNVNGTSLPL